MKSYETPKIIRAVRIDEHPDYFVFENGRVFSTKKDSFVEMSLQNKHFFVSIDCTPFAVHRLVAEAFVPNPMNLDVVHHINKNPLDNRAENLVWMSNQDHIKLHADSKKKKRQEPEVVGYYVDNTTGQKRLIYGNEEVTIAKNEKKVESPEMHLKNYVLLYTPAMSYILENMFVRKNYTALALLGCIAKYIGDDNVLRVNGEMASRMDVANDIGSRVGTFYDAMTILIDEGVFKKIKVSEIPGHSGERGDAILVNPYVVRKVQNPPKFVVNAFKESKFNPNSNNALIDDRD